jgi:hypothetical protein
MMGLSPVLTQGKEDRGGPIKATPPPPNVHPPGWQKQGEVGNVLSVVKITCTVRELIVLLQRDKLGLL